MGFLDTGSTVFYGTGVTNIKVSGKMRFVNNETIDIKLEEKKTSPKEEIIRFKKAIEITAKETRALAKRARETLGEGEGQIFEIHAMLLEDEDFNDTVIGEIEKGKSCEKAVEISAKKYASVLRSLNDEYLSARASDIEDICKSIITTLSAKNEKNDDSNEPYILVARDLTPSETVKLDKSKILGFVTFEGSPSSHTAILARAMSIPALVGVGEISRAYDGNIALLDGEKGTLVVSPSNDELLEFEKKKAYENKIATEHERYLRSIMNRPAVTKRGHKVLIYANVGSGEEIEPALLNGAEGLGLLRSEFLYLSRSSYPSEDELFSAYYEIATKMQGKRAIIRTLDIGADKQIPYFKLDKEENPALGYRGVRICLDRVDVFKTQIRAILRASAYGNISIMIPMISTLNELERCKYIINECKNELKEKGVRFDEKIELGIMIETPASALISDELAKEVDFFSVGTNDLTQYTLAIDRQNAKVTSICEENKGAVFKLIKMSADAIHQKGGWIGVCGEMAADLSLTQHFVDMGIDELSVAVPYLLGVREKVCACK